MLTIATARDQRKPFAAYVILANGKSFPTLLLQEQFVTNCTEVREELRGQDITLVGLAKIVGERWVRMSESEKSLRKQAASARSRE